MTALAVFSQIAASAESSSKQPYIDLIKKGMPEAESKNGASSEGYTERLRQKLPARNQESSEGYSQKLKDTDPGAKTPSQGYSEKVKSGLPPSDSGGAIQAVSEGRSDLKPKKSGTVRNAAGFRMAAQANRDIVGTNGAASRKFSEIYGDGWAPDFTLFYEWQPIRGWYGNFGLHTSIGFQYFASTAKFEYSLTKPNGTAFGTTSRTDLKFFTVPVHVGGKYTFTVSKYLQPYAYFGPAAIFYMERRSDRGGTVSGYSKGMMGGGGANILMDFLSPTSSWDLYSDYGIKHFYLTVDYTRMFTFASDLQFTISQISAGLSYEF